MRALKQAFKHDPTNGVWGDCFRTALAALLDLDRDDVPHFMHGAPNDAGESSAIQDAIEGWLRSRGLTRITLAWPGTCPIDDIMQTIKNGNGSGLGFLLSGRSRNGTNHVVVCCDGEIFCDPAIDNSGIVGPCDDGNWWVEFIGAAAARRSGGLGDER